MVCQRCRGLLVREPIGDLNITTGRPSLVTRCINCGCIEDAVVRANRFRPSVRRRVLPGRRVTEDTGARIKTHEEKHVAIR
jgi:hypothetical protein